jgi:short chain dehydrogenase
MTEHAKPPFPKQKQPMPGKTDSMEPVPDHGEKSYRGSGRLAGKKAIITGADSGIGRAVAIAYAREGADVLIAYLNEHDDANQTERFVKDAGRKAAHSLTITSRQTLLLPAGGGRNSGSGTSHHRFLLGAEHERGAGVRPDYLLRPLRQLAR